MNVMNPYVAGSTNKLNGYIPSSSRGEDALLKSDYYQIIDNCLDAVRNSPAARGIIQTREDYIAGSGLTPSQGNAKAIEVFNNWAKKPVDISGTKSFNQMVRDVVFSYSASGDVLLTTPIDPLAPEGTVSLRLELTSGARVRTPFEYYNKKDANGCVVRFGVAYLNGVEFGYYVANSDDLSNRATKNEFKFIRKYDENTGRLNAVLIRRPSGMSAEQTRGLSVLTPVLQTIKDLDDLMVSAIQGSRNKAYLSVVLTSEDIGGVYSGAGAVDADGNLIESTSSTGEAQIIGELPDGAMMTAPAGTKVNTINSSGDIDRDALILRCQRLISAGVGTPYEILYKDFSQTNFSSGKLAFDSFFRMSEYETSELIKVFKEINKWIQIEAWAGGFGVSDLNEIDIEFIGSQNFVDADPAKNSKAETERLGNNLTSVSRLLAQKGIQFNDVLLEKAQEYLEAKQMAEDLDIPMSLLYPTTQSEQVLQVVEEVEQIEGEEDE